MITKHTTSYNSGSLRVISGIWKGRKITFPNKLDIRPTSDRTRETLFNWLNPYIKNSICLDLFAGSGALGIEALSRGAKNVVAVEQNLKAIQYLRENIKKLDTTALQIINSTIPSKSRLFDYTFDIIFVDPPFHKNLLSRTINWLIEQEMLHNHTLIYLEQEKSLLSEYPGNWLELRTKYTKQTKYQLLQVNY